jgi:hypothetical protein
MFNIGDRVIVKDYDDMPEEMRTNGISRVAGKAGVIIDKMHSEAKGSTVYRVHLDGYAKPSRVDYIEDILIEESATTYGFEFDYAENLVSARFYSIKGEKKCLIARGHGHVFHDGELGIAQAASYALKRIYMTLNGGGDE